MWEKRVRLVVSVIGALCLAGSATGVKVFWNIPTFMCHKYGISFDNLYNDYGITQNQGDEFRGDKISILYDPGIFPALLENTSSQYLYRRNGGVPQEGNLQKHLQVFQKQLEELVPDKDNNGLIVINFESWRPIFRQNFGALQPYKNLSLAIESKKHKGWNNKQLLKEATTRFETTGRRFMADTIKLAQKLRPYAKWGYYAFPYCFNGRGNNPETCPSNVRQENNKLGWLFKNTDVILPSVYMSELMPLDARLKMVSGRVYEARRMRDIAKSAPEIYTYVRPCYTDSRRYLEEDILFGTFDMAVKMGVDGIILWESSNDLNSREKCMNFQRYLRSTLGPIARTFTGRIPHVQRV